ncbi:MAG TPA: dihydrodipicolinate reductase C-terminal domain-containing protein [Gemmatimonadaceae bacterium]|nr:dihydrodipicolinate reductase C-terminal domain-containing protein [Gemmatimonadaceae bacterium]
MSGASAASPPILAIVGDGRMGRAVARLAAERAWPVVATLGSAGNEGARAITAERLADAEVAIEFTTAAAAPANVRALLRAGCPVVSGTTGWGAELPAVVAEAERCGGSLFYAANFSLGVAAFADLVERAAASLARLPGFDAHIVETHHAAKRDAPSGTARLLAERARAGAGHEPPITSVRVGAVPGTHEVVFDAPFEQVRLTHEARDRLLFADGALAAAAWLRGRRGVFGMRDLLASLAERS